MPDSDKTPRPRTLTLKRLGVAGFAFFALKGLLWIAVPYLLSRLR